MRRKRSTGKSRKPGKGDPRAIDPSVARLAAVLEAIAAMDALPRVASSPNQRRRR
jgi:hypothetical protein